MGLYKFEKYKDEKLKPIKKEMDLAIPDQYDFRKINIKRPINNDIIYKIL